MSWLEHKEAWKNCERCHLSKVRRRVVLLRGKIPADILFIGEAPGLSEDSEGKPFSGPAGKLLDRMLETAIDRAENTQDGALRMAYTNIVGCVPKEAKGGSKISEPPIEAVDACRDRIFELVRLVKPLAIGLIGKMARKYIKSEEDFLWEEEDGLPWLDSELIFSEIDHPAYLLRADVVTRGLLIQRNVVKIETLIESVMERKHDAKIS